MEFSHFTFLVVVMIDGFRGNDYNMEYKMCGKNVKTRRKNMSENIFLKKNPPDSLEINQNIRNAAKADKMIYQMMHKDKVVAVIGSNGMVEIKNSEFLPYDLYLEEEHDFDTTMNNMMNFYHWCSSRVLTLDRKYAKEILNSIGVAQAVTDMDRARIALSYHCVSLMDVFWVKLSTENITFSDINLYDNHLNEALVDIPLRGKQMTVTNHELAQDLSTGGYFPKAWIRESTGFKLLKDGGADVVRRELLASYICQHFDVKQVQYRSFIYEGEEVSESKIITSKQYSIVSKMSYDIYACNHDLDTLEVCKQLDPETYYGMNIIDYLVGNTDRHPENWGFMVDNDTNKIISLYPLMDFNQSFQSYDTLDGANCQTVLPHHLNQREAAVEAVENIGLRQLREVELDRFGDMDKERDMFERRLLELKNAERKS